MIRSRKQRNIYLALLLCVVYAAALFVDGDPASFVAFAGAVTGILGVGNFSIAYEDARKPQHFNGKAH